jgi:hypothetical protein
VGGIITLQQSPGVTPGLTQHALADVIQVTFEVDALFEHALTRHVQDTACDNPSGLSTGVHIDGRYHVFQAHRLLPPINPRRLC